MGLLETLILGSYAFTASAVVAGAAGFFYLYRLIANHVATRLKKLEKKVFGDA